MSARPDVSVVLGTFNRMRFLELAVESVRRELVGVPHEIIAIDGGSTDGGAEWLVGQKDIVTIVQHNRGTWRGKPVARRPWAYFMNLGFRCAGGTYVCMISDDCLVVPGAIRNGCRLFGEALASGRKVGAVAFYWRNWPEETRYRVGLTLGDRMFVNHGLYLRRAIEEAGYFDEETFSFYHADGDLGLAMWRLGYECIDSPESFIEHYAHVDSRRRSANSARQKEDWARYLGKWEGIFYSREKDDIGGWIEKEHRDPHGTAEEFRRAARGRPDPVEAVRAAWGRIRGRR